MKPNTGYTAEYARLLADKPGLPVYSLEEAIKKLPAGNSVVYLGWLMAGHVQGYKKAARKYDVQAVCGVGMGATGSQLSDVRKANAIAESTPVFTMQGGFDLARLKGIYRFMMTVMAKTAGKSLAEKSGRTADEDAMLDLLQNGGSRVSQENLSAVLRWYLES